MFGIGLPELIVIMVVALLVVGPSKLPELARSIGKSFHEFRRMADDVKEALEQEAPQTSSSEAEIAENKPGTEEGPKESNNDQKHIVSEERAFDHDSEKG